MHSVRLSRLTISVGLIIGMLSGCGGSPIQIGTPPAMQQNAVRTEQSIGAHRWSRRATSTSAFTVSGRNILLNGTPFFIKGVDYGPNQIDSYADPNPLDNANEPVWKPDLAAMRAAGVNAVKLYAINLKSFQPYVYILGNDHKLLDYETGKIDKFLDQAWNNGDHPIYVVLSVFFGGDDILRPKYVDALKTVYNLMATEYAAHPAVMGISIGSEINSRTLIHNPVWWKGLNEVSDSITKAYEAVNAQKINTTTMVDDGLETVRAGELAKFKVDAWGVDVYRGRTMGRLWNEISEDTARPVIIAEYGASSAYYPPSSARYDFATGSCTDYPPGTGEKPYYGLPPPHPWELARELPKSPGANPRMQFLVEYATRNATEIFTHRAPIAGGLTSGGFYFEWNDEWWKSGWPFLHIGGFEGNKIINNAEFPGCYDDQAWFGLFGDKKNGTGDKPFPMRSPDIREAKPTFGAIKAVWAKEQ
jgi:hypothetical protein